jgi:hypothetical protein
MSLRNQFNVDGTQMPGAEDTLESIGEVVVPSHQVVADEDRTCVARLTYSELER